MIPAQTACPNCGAPFADGRLDLCAACLLAIAAGADPRTGRPGRRPADPSAAAEGAARLAPGQMFGPYRIERLLGRGGMGEVYEATQLAHGRRVAVKVVTGHVQASMDRSRFLREGQLAASVHHPNSVYISGPRRLTACR